VRHDSEISDPGPGGIPQPRGFQDIPEAIAVSVLAEVLLALAGIMLVSTVAVVVVARVIYTRIRRSRLIGDSVLRARATLTIGRTHEVLRLRVRLSEALSSGRAALDLARTSGQPTGELQRLFERIRSEAAAVDAHLALLMSERDAPVLSEAIPAAGQRVDQIRSLVRRLRSSVAAGIGGVTDDALAGLSVDVDREIAALDAGLRELHSLTTDTHTPGRRAS
jgi:hypothetical protein